MVGYKLAFGKRWCWKLGSGHWKGGVATIEEDINSKVYGVLWELGVEHLKTLDDQEGVSKNVYRKFEVKVKLCGKNGDPEDVFPNAYTHLTAKDQSFYTRFRLINEKVLNVTKFP